MSRIAVTIVAEDPHVAAVLEKYWHQDDSLQFRYKAADLAAELGLRTHQLSALVTQYTLASVPDWACPQCETEVPLRSRAEYQQRLSAVNWASRSGNQTVCADCRKVAQVDQRSLAEKAEALRREKVSAKYRARPLGAIAEYTLRDVVCLLAFIRIAASESLDWLSPLRLCKEILTPVEASSIETLRDLHDRGLIAVHPGSALDAFKWTNDEPDIFYLDKVHWTVGADSEDARWFVRNAEAALQSQFWPLGWLLELPQLIEEFLIDECIQYLQHCLSEHHLPFTSGEKTKLTFTSVLQEYGLGQVQNLIWRQAKDAAALYQRGGISRQHAANTVPGGIQRSADRARAERWDLRVFNRNPRIPQSATSHILFVHALALGVRLQSLTLRSVAQLESAHLLRVAGAIEEMRECLEEDRPFGRTRFHELLDRFPVESPTLEVLADMVEEVTMGTTEWESFTADANLELDQMKLPRYL